MRKTLQIEKTIYTIADLILPDAPQVALAGRSNVGKSSLVNRLAGRKQLAKTSSTPGKTQSINLYSVAPGAYYLVDLPGYGYAKYSKTERAKWAKLIEKYLTGNRLLHAVAVLLDCRLTPQASDLDMVAWLRAESIPMIGVLTKADKCTQRERQAQKAVWTPLLGGAAPVLFSSVTGMGYDELWARFDAAVGYAPGAEGGPGAAQPASGDTEPPA